ncbi:hypothetical protein [Pseudoroseicyclus aestuarii]|uniref:Uncharacterized protein n=1 Tax=Pseudoroseicyclus aestuarii TaxID=1795041 RepID=A0A318SM65_9RHOB|nr:hypothetical protein [Pseudoroseicyclus aestuarii]PYE80796.1 hypothetical protein DFP88_1116 [Pseudoroseicyclus aestuarii]
MSEPLFAPDSTHAEVRCWQCGHEVTVKPNGLPAGISGAEFERRARCQKCGTGWPHVKVFPVTRSKWGM